MGLSAQSPFDTYTACMAGTVGDSEMPDAGSQLMGVPMGQNCGMRDGGNTTTSTTTFTMGSDSSKDDTKRPAEVKPADEDTDWTDRIADILDTASEFLEEVVKYIEGENPPLPPPNEPPTGGVAAAGGVIVGIELQLLSKPAAEGMLGAGTAIAEWTLGDALAAGMITPEEYFQYRHSKPADKVEFLKSKRQDCFDFTACSDDCTGLGQQLNAIRDCTDDFLRDIASRSGLKSSKDVPKERSLAPYSHPRPDGDTSEDATSSGACLGSDNQPTDAGVCGLILCEGQHSSPVNGGCACDDSSSRGWFRVVNVCAEVFCSDGSVPDENCQCKGALPYEPLPPRPEPPFGVTDLIRPGEIPARSGIQVRTGTVGESLPGKEQPVRPPKSGKP